LLRILVADDHADIRRRIRSLLETQNWNVCGEAASGREALEKVRRLRPDVVLLDITMPDVSGLEATRRIASESPKPDVLVLTMHRTPELASEVMGAGAAAIIDKSEAYEKLINAIRALRRKIHMAGVIVEGVRHIGAFFHSDDDAYRVLGSFIHEGLQAGEKSFHILDQRNTDLHMQRLMDSGIDAARARSRGQLEFLSWDAAYLRNGHFDQHTMLELIKELLRSGPADGFPKNRHMARMEWALQKRAGVEDLVEYESRLNDVLPKFEDVVTCVYKVTDFSAGVIMDVMRSHPAIVVGGVFRENPFYLPPEQMLEELRLRAH